MKTLEAVLDHTESCQPLIRWFREHVCEDGDDIPDVLADVLKRLNERGEYKDRRIVQLYLNGDVAPHLHGKLLLGGRAVRFCLIFRNAEKEHLAGTHGGHDGKVEFPVFVPVAEFSENGQPIRTRVAAAVIVGLQLADDCLGLGGNALYKSGISGRYFFIEGGVVGEYRECGVAGGSIAGRDDELVGQMVERRSQVMEDFSDQDAKTNRHISICMNLLRPLARLLVYCIDDTFSSVRRFVQEGLDFAVQVDDLLVGPLNLRPTAIERMVAHGRGPFVSEAIMRETQEQDDKAKTQETDEGYEIPVPERGAFYEALEKASEPEDEEDSDRSAGGEEQE